MTEGKTMPIAVTDPFARKLMNQYLDNRRKDIDKLTSALEDSDFETIRITGHNLLGSGSAYGLDGISGIGESIEKAAESADEQRIERLIGELRDFLKWLKVL